VGTSITQRHSEISKKFKEEPQRLFFTTGTDLQLSNYLPWLLGLSFKTFYLSEEWYRQLRFILVEYFAPSNTRSYFPQGIV